MFIFKLRKLGKILRGKANAFQLLSAAILGSLLGFMPGFSQAWGLIAALLLVLIILNANLFFAGLITLLAKGVSLLLTPVSFAVGRFLLEGPTEGLFRSMVNAPVLAFFGLEYYVVTGGLLLGLIFGVVVGVATVKGLKAYWRKMAYAQKDSERYKQWSSKKWVKAVSWIFLGPAKKDTYEDTLSKGNIGNPIRLLGAVFAVLVAVVAFAVNLLFADEIVTQAVRGGLERANGATVNLERGELSFRDGRLTLNNLAMADPDDLGTDLFRAALIEADIDTRDLLRKRWTIDRLVISEGRQGEPRTFPGTLTQPRPRPTPDPDLEPDEKTIEDYLRDAQKWRERLAQVRHWLDVLSGPDDEEMELPPDVDPEDVPMRETRRERIAREIREKGYDQVIARHLIEDSPRLLIRDLTAERVRTRHLEDDTLDITGQNLSTNPRLVPEAPRLSIRSSSGDLVFDLVLGAAAALQASNDLELVYRNLPSDVIGRQLAISGEPPVSGGTFDFETSGRLSKIDSDLPLRVTLRNTTLTIPGVGQTDIDELTLPIGIRGAIDNPRVSFDDRDLADALAAAGRRELESRLRQELSDRIGGDVEERVRDEIRDRVGDEAEERVRDEVEERGRDLLDRLRR
jgi:uncharacterized protein (TIGR03546 family)